MRYWAAKAPSNQARVGAENGTRSLCRPPPTSSAGGSPWHPGGVKHSEFWQVVDATLVGYGRSVAEDLVLPGVGGRTAAQALAAGVEPRAVWHALCDELELDDAARWRHRVEPPRRR